LPELERENTIELFTRVALQLPVNVTVPACAKFKNVKNANIEMRMLNFGIKTHLFIALKVYILLLLGYNSLYKSELTSQECA